MITHFSNARSVAARVAAASVVVLLAAACGGREDAGTEQAAPSARSAEATGSDAATQSPRPIRADPKNADSGQPGGAGAQARTGRQPDGRMRIENGGAAIELPAEFPADIPVFPEATPTLFSIGHDGQRTTSMTVDETMDGALRYYEDELEREGWELDRSGSQAAATDLIFLNATKGGRVLLVGIVDKDGETVVSLIETPE